MSWVEGFSFLEGGRVSHAKLQEFLTRPLQLVRDKRILTPSSLLAEITLKKGGETNKEEEEDGLFAQQSDYIADEHVSDYDEEVEVEEKGEREND